MSSYIPLSCISAILILFVVTIRLPALTAHFNLFMNKTETLRVLGINAELYYVRSGVENQQALSFSLPVRDGINELYFSWQNMNDTQMVYSIDTWVNDTSAVVAPQVDIISNGTVPHTLSAFSVSFSCSGERSAGVFLEINVKISSPEQETSDVFMLKRNKKCIEGYINNEMNGSGNVSYVITDFSGFGFSLSSSSLLYILLGACCTLCVSVASIAAVCYMRTQKHHRQQLSESDVMSSELREECLSPNLNTSSESNQTDPLLFDINQVNFAERNIKLLTEDHITLQQVLQAGTFGCVYEGLLSDEEDLSNTQQVYVKTVTEEARSDQSDCMLNEGCAFSNLSHANLLTILGVCTESAQPMIIYPYMEQGNLKQFLLNSKIADNQTNLVLNTQQLVYVAVQLVRAVQFIHKKKLVHMDIATRNCVIDSKLSVKLTDNSLSRDLFPHDYHCLGDNENRPIKWLAYESLVEHVFSTSSDMWSLGVLLWELMTCADQPYMEVDPFEMETYLREGYRMSQPHNCPDELFAVMACCWATVPDERPKIAQLLSCLQDFYNALNKFI